MMPGGDTWIALPEEDKNMSLIQATRWLETLDYRGDRCTGTQRLKYAPRSGAECDGVTSVCMGIPYPIQEAEVALAIKYSESPGTFPGAGEVSAPTGTYVKRQKIDVLEIEQDEFSNPESSSCDSCGDPSIIQTFPGSATCWAVGSPESPLATTKMIRLFRN